MVLLMPKGIMHHHKNALFFLTAFSTFCGIDKMGCYPMYFPFLMVNLLPTQECDIMAWVGSDAEELEVPNPPFTGRVTNCWRCNTLHFTEKATLLINQIPNLGLTFNAHILTYIILIRCLNFLKGFQTTWQPNPRF